MPELNVKAISKSRSADAKMVQSAPLESIAYFVGDEEDAKQQLIPHLIDQNPCAHWRNPMDMIFQGRSTSMFQA